jgi:3',5'-cyclic AMP phosphodiesterase CpdA
MRFPNKNSFILLMLLILSSMSLCVQAQTKPKQVIVDQTAFKFYIVSDAGRNGYYKQKIVAQTMGRLAEIIRPKFILDSGDTFHYNGVRSISDPLWLTNFEMIYSHPELQVDWYPVFGNHEYRGNTQALIDYSQISRRWNMPAHYYTFSRKIDAENSIRIVCIDTSPFLKEYRNLSDQFPDVALQDTIKQLKWIDSVLTVSNEKWKIVMGHHPMYSVDSLHGNTQELIRQLDPILRKHHVDFYFSGHIHSAQHIQKDGMDYIVSASASLNSPAKYGPYTKFESSAEGFTVCTIKNGTFEIIFVNEKGEELYRYKKIK